MSYVSPEDIALAKEMDLLTYLQNYEPQNLKRVARSTYCTREHDSLKISNGKWHWFSRGVGGKTAPPQKKNRQSGGNVTQKQKAHQKKLAHNILAQM